MGERRSWRLGVRMTAVVVAIAAAAVGLAACGGGDETSSGPGPFADEIIACLEARGAEAELLDEGFGIEAVGGRTPYGDAVFVFHTPDPETAARAIEAMKKTKEDADLGGVMLMSAVNGGATVVGAVGREGVDGGIPSDRSEALAKSCAVRPRT